MSVRLDIALHSSEEDRPILLFLLDKYHMQSEWNFVATGKWVNGNLVWRPTEAGLILYNHFIKENK